MSPLPSRHMILTDTDSLTHICLGSLLSTKKLRRRKTGYRDSTDGRGVLQTLGTTGSKGSRAGQGRDCFGSHIDILVSWLGHSGEFIQVSSSRVMKQLLQSVIQISVCL